jgi:cadmium resistance protein CadD (predicted permease)
MILSTRPGITYLGYVLGCIVLMGVALPVFFVMALIHAKTEEMK